jgi:hypothetical protein
LGQFILWIEVFIKIYNVLGALKKKKLFTSKKKKKMNDLVFIMYNLKIKDKRVNPSTVRREISMEDLSSDDEWLATEDIGDVGDDDDDDDLFDRVAQHSPYNLIDEDD